MLVVWLFYYRFMRFFAMNKIKKGYRKEKKVREYLEDLGYKTEIKNRSMYNANDFWGLFDVLAVGRDVLLVQVKSNRADMKPSQRMAVQKFRVPENVRKLLFVWKDREHKPDVYDLNAIHWQRVNLEKHG